MMKRLVALTFVGVTLVGGAAACGDDEDALEGMRQGLTEQGVSDDDAECVTDYVRDNVDDIADKIVEDNQDPEVTAALQDGMAECGLTGGGDEEVTDEEVTDDESTDDGTTDEPADEEMVEEGDE